MSVDRVMLLIDADNVSVDVMEQAVRLLLNQHGGLHVRRAYCTAESAVSNQAAFKRLGIKPMVNLAAGKNSTDIALAVDAIDLVLAERPDVVVIASSDSDFAPLVHRLREKGCVVRGIGQQGKTGDETQAVYDDFTVLEHRKSAASAAAAEDRPKRAPRKTAATKTAPAKTAPAKKSSSRAAPAKKAVAAKTPAAKAPARKTPARKTRRPAAEATDAYTPTDVDSDEGLPEAVMAMLAAPAAPAAPAASARTARANVAPNAAPSAAPNAAANAASNPAPHAEPAAARSPTSLAAVLACLPELTAGQGLALNVAVQRLREARLLGKNTPSPKFFSQLSEGFELLPADKPSQVRWRG